MQVHPLEVFMITLAIYLPFLLFAHPLVLWCFAFLVTINATIAHSGYKIGFFSMTHVPIFLTAEDHRVHHEQNREQNFGNILNVWDKMFNTYSAPDKE
jgi:sterol desaturase/sphingolipid hydroxylase (fatty acid hydroxylase superfamily)